MEWPSKNVPKGGVFNNARVKYSPETQEFVRTLMKESKLTMLQRNKMDYSLRNGEPLPPLTTPPVRNRRPQLFEVRVRPGSSKRRSLDTIRQSGAYDREVYHPMPMRIDREKEKEALIEKMTHGASKPEGKANTKATPKSTPNVEPMNRFEELKKEIQEREEWLAEMEELGEGAKYRGLMRLQILERIKEMETLSVQH